MKTAQSFGRKVIVDHDDNIFQVSPFSPHYKDLGLSDQNFYKMANGETIPMWPDIDVEKNKERIDVLVECMKECDMITVTTDKLGDAYRHLNPNVKALPNCVNLDLWNRPTFKEDGIIRLGWHGGFSHYEDIKVLKNVMPVIFSKYPNIEFHMAGFDFAKYFKDWDQSRVVSHNWVPTAAHPYKMALLNIDIGIIPLVDNIFNMGKSAIKWIEYAALQTPCVTSYITPYKEMYDGENGVFVENSDDAWIAGICTLIDDSILRAKIGALARKTVEKYYDINTQYVQWENTYKELVHGGPVVTNSN